MFLFPQICVHRDQAPSDIFTVKSYKKRSNDQFLNHKKKKILSVGFCAKFVDVDKGIAPL